MLSTETPHSSITEVANRLPMIDSRHWFALYTMSNHERRVEQHLQSKSVERFLPLCTVTKRWKNRTTARIQLPLFAGYVFARFAPTEKVKLLEIPGVLAIVSNAGKPCPIGDQEIQTLQEGLRLRRVDPYPYLTVGKRARIRSGPLVGLEGIVVRKDDRLHIVLTLDLIMRSVAVHVEADELEPCGPQNAVEA